MWSQSDTCSSVLAVPSVLEALVGKKQKLNVPYAPVVFAVTLGNTRPVAVDKE